MSPAEPEARLQFGLDLHQQGRLEEAARAYRDVLALDGHHSGALHWLGVIAFQKNELATALDLISRSLAINPDFAVAHSNLGNVLKGLGRLDEALAGYDRAIALSPDYPGSHNNRGVVLTDMKRFDEALASFATALALFPDYAEAHSNRGVVLYDTRRFDEALASYDRAVALNPDYAEAHHNRGMALKQLRRFEEALASYDRALALWPDYAHAHCNRGIVLGDLRRFDEALAGFDRALAIEPDHADAHYNRAAALADLRRFELALAGYDRAIKLRPGFADAHCNRGLALYELARFDEAQAAYDAAIAIDPDCHGALFNQAMLHLLFERFDPGWKGYEWRHVLQDAPAKAFRRPRLASLEQARGRTILVHGEQGLGDTIQFFRYAALLREAGAEVLFAPQPALRALLASRSGEIRLVSADDAALVFDFHIPVMSLPLLFATGADTIPAAIPYIAAEADRVAAWRKQIGDSGFKVGICWHGNRLRHDFGRSFPVAAFEGLSRLAGVRLISLHKGDGEHQLQGLPAGMTVETLGSNFDSGAYAFLDTAAVMACLDLVITSDTSIAHVAGALGVPTWVLLPYVPDWRWRLGRDDSPWYPTIRLFRQPGPGDWVGVHEQVLDALRARLDE